MSFILLTLLAFWVVILLVINNDKNKIGFLYSLVILIIFYTPNLYFFFGGTAYDFFDEKSLDEYILYSSIVMLLYGLVYTVTYGCKISLSNYQLFFKESVLVKLYFFTIVSASLIYYAYFFSHFPTVHFLLEGELIERPDLTGEIPFFFTVSTIAFIVLPSAYFFYFNRFSKYQHIVVNIVIVFIFIAGGNKGLVVFYFLFLWLYIFSAKLDFRILILFLISMGIYLLTKGITEINAEVMEYLMSSPFRRFFVTQGSCFLFRLDMISDGYSYLQADSRGIKFDVFARMYNTEVVGSCPTFVTGDLLVKHGYAVSLLLFVIISFVILSLSKISFHLRCNKKLFLYWNIYFIIYLVVMSGLGSSNIFRIAFVICNFILIYSLGSIIVNKKK